MTDLGMPHSLPGHEQWWGWGAAKESGESELRVRRSSEQFLLSVQGAWASFQEPWLWEEPSFLMVDSFLK